MISRDLRLGKENIGEVLRKGVRFDTPFLYLKKRKIDRENPLFAVVVGGKVSKKAVDRNKLKRQIKAILIKNLSKIKVGFGIVIGVKKSLVNEDFSTLEKDVLYLLRKSNLLIND